MSRTIDDVLAVAGNRPVFEALVSILEARKAIAFVGAGASAGMYPLWGKFIELLADHAVAARVVVLIIKTGGPTASERQ